MFFESDRELYISKLTTHSVLSVIQIQQLQDPEFLIQLTLDASVLFDLRDFNLDHLGRWNFILGSIYSEYTVGGLLL